jgi:hypothetical protein
MIRTLSPQGQLLLNILVKHIRQPGVKADRPETLISYGEALELLNLPANAPHGPTDGKTLQLNGLNDLAQWVNKHPKMPRITGVIISRSEHDELDGARRPKFVPSVGYFKEYKRKTDDWTWWIEQVEASIAFDWSLYFSSPASPSPPIAASRHGIIEQLRPTNPLRAYDLLIEAGLTTEVPPTDVAQRLAAYRTYLSRWSFTEGDRVILCLHFHDMQEENGVIFQRLNYRTDRPEHRNWNALQKERAWAMDRAFVTAYKTGLNIRVIVVDGELGPDSKAQIQRRLLDSEPWHVASYNQIEGWCRLQRGTKPAAPETFTGEEITFAGTFTEGTQSEVTAKTRERSARLRNLAREHFSERSPDGRLHCAACSWVPPLGLALSSPIVEIHHEVAVSTLPTEGRALTFAEAVKYLTPLCPNCHRILHAKQGGGTFTLDELKREVGVPEGKANS